MQMGRIRNAIFVHASCISVLTKLSLLVTPVWPCIAAANFGPANSGPANPGPTPTKLKVGLILPLTKTGASTGKSFQNGLELALRRLPPEHRTLLEFSHDDDQMVPKNTISAFRNVLSRGRPDLVVTLTAGVGSALAPVAHAENVPYIPAVSRKTETCTGRPNCFLFWAAPRDVIALLIQHLGSIKAQRIALISATHDGPLTMVKDFKAQAGGRFEIVLEDDYPTDVNDFRAFLTRLKQTKNVDAIIVNVFQGQIGNFSRQARDLNVTVPRVGLEIHGEADEWRIADGAMAGEWYAGVGFKSESVLAEYQHAFPNSSSYASALAYDLVSILHRASQSGATDVGAYLRELQPFEGMSGAIRLDEFQRIRIEAIEKVVPAAGEAGIGHAKN